MADGRICQETGFALVAGPVSAYRIARQSYGALAPKPREASEDLGHWGRYDTVGRTIYASNERVTAYMELLAPYRTQIDEGRRALQPAADAMGVELEDYWRDIVAEWDEGGNMKAKWLPHVFRDGRAMYELQFPAGWWIDINAMETVATLNRLVDGGWPTESGSLSGPLTLSDLTGDDRTLTTAIASFIRDEVQLDDGTLPLGIRFISKHGHPVGGTGLCWAYWMRQVDAGLDEPAHVVYSHGINPNDPDYVTAQELCKIKSR